jgi:hypothetical protein
MQWTICTMFAIAGCGGPDVKGVELVRIEGVVTLDRKPLHEAVVIFEAEDGAFAFAQTGSDGRYDLWFDSRQRGVTLGPKIVRISMNRRLLGLNSNDEGGADDSAGGSFAEQAPEPIPPRYNSQSELTVLVTPDSDHFDFDLSSTP